MPIPFQEGVGYDFLLMIFYHAQPLLERGFSFPRRQFFCKLKEENKMDISQKYPSFCYKYSLVTDGRIILLDAPIEQEILHEIKSLETTDNQELLFLEDTQLAADMEIILLKITKQEQDVLFVFPGNGSGFPRRLSKICQKFSDTTASVFAKRTWQPGTDPVVEVGFIERDIRQILPVKTIIAVDDVISSGLTMKQVYENNAWKFPEAKWIAVSWVSQIPRMKAKSGITGFENVNTSCLVRKTNGGRVPINSLSTLRHSAVMLEEVAEFYPCLRQQKNISESYARRYYKEPKKFLQLVSLGYSIR